MRARTALVLIRGRSARPARAACARAAGGQPARRKQPCSTRRGGQPATQEQLPHPTKRSARHARTAPPPDEEISPPRKSNSPTRRRDQPATQEQLARATGGQPAARAACPRDGGSLPARRAQLSLSHPTNTKRDAPEAPLLRGHPSHQRRDSAAQKTQAISVEDLAKRVEVAGGRVATGDDTLSLTGTGDEAAAGVTGLAPDVGRGQP
jgi:hypothetical protein